MAKLCLAVGLPLLLAGVCLGQQQRATYFEAPPGVSTAEECKAYWQANPEVASTSSALFTRPAATQTVDLCVHFLSRNIWRHDPGLQGNCRGDCCEWIWFDSRKGLPKAPPKPWLEWFFDLDGSCSNTQDAEATPWIFFNAPSNQYTVCMRPVDPNAVETGDYAWKPVPVNVDSRNCGGPGGKCCPFNIASAADFPFKPRAPPPQ